MQRLEKADLPHLRRRAEELTCENQSLKENLPLKTKQYERIAVEVEVMDKDLKNEMFYKEQLTEKNEYLTKKLRDVRDA